MWVRRGKEGGGGSAGEMLSLEWRSLNPVIFSNLLFLLLFKLPEPLFKKKTLTQKPSMEAGRAGHLSFR